MKHLKHILALSLIALFFALTSCSKGGESKPKSAGPSPIAALSGSWNISNYGNIANNPMIFNIDTVAKTATITQLGSNPLGLNVGDKFFTGLKASGSSFSATSGTYTYGPNNSLTATRAVVITLLNGDTQMKADYPKLNDDFPEIIYYFQKGSMQ